jgi:hypothetical protein
MTGVKRGVALCALVLSGWAVAAAPANADAPRKPALAVAAQALKAVILPVVYEVGPEPSATGFVAAAGCCGWVERHVYYRAAPGAYAANGAYELSLEDIGPEAVRANATVRKVTVSEFPTLPASPFIPSPTLPATFVFSIWHDSLSEYTGWHGAVEYQRDPECLPAYIAPGCVTWHTGRTLMNSPRTLNAVLAQALGVIQKAKQHAPISTENPAVAGLRVG